MKERILRITLALVLFICLVPATATPVNASAQMHSSEKLISFIQEMEGFKAYAFWDVSQWSIGYGTPGYPGQVITEREADKAMREHLTVVDEKLNEFAAENGLTFSQNEHDALASFSFNCGTKWMTEQGRFRSAILEGTSLNDFLFYISLWANNNSIPDPILIKRRLCEANIYLNGIYSNSMPENYSFVIFDANGGTPGSNGEDKMQGYSLKQPNSILVGDPSKDGQEFVGWFTEATGGTQVTQLSASTAKRTLYAHYAGESTQEQTPQSLKKGTVQCDTYVNIRKGAGIGNAVVGMAANGTRVEIHEEKAVGSAKWGRTASGWICMDYVMMDGEEQADTAKPIQTGKVSSTTSLNVRSGPGTNYGRVGMLTPGTEVSIYELKTQSNQSWGRIGNKRWVCMDYVAPASEAQQEQEKTQETEASPAEPQKAVFQAYVSSKTNLNVRSGPGVGFSRVGSLIPGTAVQAYEKKQSGASAWARIGDDRWVCTDYLTVRDSQQTTQTTLGAGTVISQTVLNVRSGAGIGCGLVNQITPGTRVTILEKKASGGYDWGRTAAGWVCMDYIRMDV